MPTINERKGGSVGAQEVKDAVNAGLDHLESAGFALADITPGGPTSLTQRLSDLLYKLEEWKADAWEVLDRLDDHPTSPCGGSMVGSGTDTYDPTCELPKGHDGSCRSRSAIDQHRLTEQDLLTARQPYRTALLKGEA